MAQSYGDYEIQVSTRLWPQGLAVCFLIASVSEEDLNAVFHKLFPSRGYKQFLQGSLPKLRTFGEFWRN